MFLSKYVKDIDLNSKSFTIEIALTVRFFLIGARFHEMQIEYYRRKEGKKLEPLKDGTKAIIKILQYGRNTFFAKVPIR